VNCGCIGQEVACCDDDISTRRMTLRRDGALEIKARQASAVYRPGGVASPDICERCVTHERSDHCLGITWSRDANLNCLLPSRGHLEQVTVTTRQA
jgi:hypothetical protein